MKKTTPQASARAASIAKAARADAKTVRDARLNEICERVRKCRTRKEAIRISADLIMVHTNGSFRAEQLGKQVADELPPHGV